jgi:peptidoglycan/xylan/chitin deacetylase (PgdA/CDA1 family)
MPPPNHSRRAFIVGALAAGVAATATACGHTDPSATADASSTVGAPSSAPTSPVTTPSAAVPSTPTSAASSTTGQAAPASSSTTAAGPPGPVTATFVDHADNAGSNLALTFHTNGDLSLVQQLADVLSSHHAVATCFIVGNWLEANPSWAKKLTDAGHELANHTYTHPDFTTLTAATMATEITKCRDVIRRLTGSGGRFFRPSGTDDGTANPGPTIIDQAGKAGYPMVAGFDVDPFDYKDPGADAVRQRTLAAVHPGAIVSLHFGHPGTIAALPAILDGITAKGLTPVTMSRLLP